MTRLGRNWMCFVLYLEERHRRNVAAADARQRAEDARDLLVLLRDIGHGAVTTKPPSSTYADGGAARSTPAPHPSPRPDEPKEIQ